MKRSLVRSIPIIAILLLSIISCKKKNTEPESLIANIGGVRYWEGKSSYHSPFGSSENDVTDTFEITSLSDTQISVKNKVLTLKSTDESNQMMRFALDNDVHYTVEYYYAKDSIYYRENSSMAASQLSVTQLHTVD